MKRKKRIKMRNVVDINLPARMRELIDYDPDSLIVLITGSPGSGKSETGLSLSDMIDIPREKSQGFRNYYKQNTVVDAGEFLARLNGYIYSEHSVVFWDEAGLDLDPREAMTQENRSLKNVFESFRRRNIGVVFTCPSKYIDKSIRRIVDFFVECNDIDKRTEENVVDFYSVDTRARYDQMYYRWPEIRTEGYPPVKIGRGLHIQRAPKEIRDWYNSWRDEKQDEFNKTEFVKYHKKKWSKGEITRKKLEKRIATANKGKGEEIDIEEITGEEEEKKSKKEKIWNLYKKSEMTYAEIANTLDLSYDHIAHICANKKKINGDPREEEEDTGSEGGGGE